MAAPALRPLLLPLLRQEVRVEALLDVLRVAALDPAVPVLLVLLPFAAEKLGLQYPHLRHPTVSAFYLRLPSARRPVLVRQGVWSVVALQP